MLVKTKGIIFKSIKYSETSLIADIYTEELGLQKYIISGVRSKKAKTRSSLLQIMSLVELVVYHHDNRDLHRIKEIRPAYIYTQLPFDVRRSSIGQFMAEVARKTIRQPEKNKPLYQFLLDTYTHLDQTPHSIANLHLLFLLELSFYLGFVPGGDYSKETPFFDLQEGYFVPKTPTHQHFLEESESQLLDQLLNSSKSSCHQLEISRKERSCLLEHLLSYYRLHIENFPTIHSHQILQEVLG